MSGIDWERNRWPHEYNYGSDTGWSATYNGHDLAVKENGGPYTMYVDGQPLPNDDRREGIKQLHSAASAKDYVEKWVTGKIKPHPKGAVLAPELGFGMYYSSQHVSVSVMVDGKFEVQIEDPFEPRYDADTKIFKAGQDPVPWITKRIEVRMKKWLPEFFKHQGKERHP